MPGAVRGRGEGRCLITALHHYTCADHGGPGIASSREIWPNRHPYLRTPLVWLTDLAEPDRWALGLTSAYLSCDRTAVRVSVALRSEIVPWHWWAHRERVPRVIRELLEDGAMPAHWWVCESPLSVLSMSDVAVFPRSRA